MRVVTGAVGIPIVLAAVWFGDWPFFLFMCVVIAGALLEYYWIVERTGARPNKGVGLFFAILLAFSFFHGASDVLMPGAVPGAAAHGAFVYSRFLLIAGLLALFVLTTLIAEMGRSDPSPIRNNTATLGGVLYVGLFLSTVIGIRQLFGGDPLMNEYVARATGSVESVSAQGAFTLMAALVTIWICDSAAYYAGRALGRHKLSPRISPKKTWEGAAAGLLAAVLTMVGFQQWLIEYLRLGDAIVLGLVVGTLGQIGDLAESHVKRDAGVKDSSQFIPGHGGIFDRFDSLMFVAPVVYLYLNVIMLLRG
jgi:phosphatidate cytidylyltransferase